MNYDFFEPLPKIIPVGKQPNLCCADVCSLHRRVFFERRNCRAARSAAFRRLQHRVVGRTCQPGQQY